MGLQRSKLIKNKALMLQSKEEVSYTDLYKIMVEYNLFLHRYDDTGAKSRDNSIEEEIRLNLKMSDVPDKLLNTYKLIANYINSIKANDDIEQKKADAIYVAAYIYQILFMEPTLGDESEEVAEMFVDTVLKTFSVPVQSLKIKDYDAKAKAFVKKMMDDGWVFIEEGGDGEVPYVMIDTMPDENSANKAIANVYYISDLYKKYHKQDVKVTEGIVDDIAKVNDICNECKDDTDILTVCDATLREMLSCLSKTKDVELAEKIIGEAVKDIQNIKEICYKALQQQNREIISDAEDTLDKKIDLIHNKDQISKN